MENEFINKLNRTTIERYNKRLDAAGPGAYALGWGKKEFQVRRFYDVLHVLDCSDLQDKRVLDIGCGLGDFFSFLGAIGIAPKKYLGIDINQRLIDIAKKNNPEASFATRDLATAPYLRSVADTAIMLGVLNFKIRNQNQYAYKLIKNSFDAVSNVLLVNLISDVHNSEYSREDFINYYKPHEVLQYAQQITPFCAIIQDYEAAPQYELMLVMRKKPWKTRKK